MSETFYKLAKPDGWDFFTGKTINYRENVGKSVRPPQRNRNVKKVRLCSDTCLHASRDLNRAFVGAKIPCSVFLVTGKPHAEDKDKCGFKQLKIIKELKPEKVFKWDYKEAINPTNPFQINPPKRITRQCLTLLKQWASVWDSVWASVWDSVWASVWDSVWASVWDSVWAYAGWIFRDVVKEWKYAEHKKGEYPFQPGVDLWFMGLVPSFDGEKWRLHGSKDGKMLWEGEV